MNGGNINYDNDDGENWDRRKITNNNFNNLKQSRADAAVMSHIWETLIVDENDPDR
jgi:hypothetical protein